MHSRAGADCHYRHSPCLLLIGSNEGLVLMVTRIFMDQDSAMQAESTVGHEFAWSTEGSLTGEGTHGLALAFHNILHELLPYLMMVRHVQNVHSSEPLLPSDIGSPPLETLALGKRSRLQDTNRPLKYLYRWRNRCKGAESTSGSQWLLPASDL
jgi:hypothetical protein